MTALGFDTRSLKMVHAAWREAPSGDLTMLVGEHRAEFIGPSWLRLSAPRLLAGAGLRGWHGKAFHEPASDSPDRLSGANLLRRRSGMVRSGDMCASIEESEIDGRPAIVVRYAEDSRWPWPGVTDHFRPVGEDVLLGLTRGLPMSPRGGAPFLVHRTSLPAQRPD